MIKKILILVCTVLICACSSTPSYKYQEYAKLNHAKEYEDEFDVVWKGVLDACADFKAEKVEKDNGLMMTDWVYATSNEKYVEYTVNGLPRKHFLQLRYKYKITVEKFVGKVKVTVLQYEQLEKTKSDGTFDEWNDTNNPDSSRAADMISKIDNKILSRH